MTPLSAHKGDEVERAQVNLEELLQAVWLHCYLWTPGAIALLKVQPGRDTERKCRVGEMMFIFELQQEMEKSKREKKN